MSHSLSRVRHDGESERTRTDRGSKPKEKKGKKRRTDTSRLAPHHAPAGFLPNFCLLRPAATGPSTATAQPASGASEDPCDMRGPHPGAPPVRPPRCTAAHGPKPRGEGQGHLKRIPRTRRLVRTPPLSDLYVGPLALLNTIYSAIRRPAFATQSHGAGFHSPVLLPKPQLIEAPQMEGR